MKHTIFITILFLFFTKTINHQQNSQNPTSKEVLKYIFMGHTYKSDSKVDPRLEKFDFSDYDGVWLGGDICSEASREINTLIYLDSLFDLSNPLTFWALGNHDTRNGNYEWFRRYTKRETYFAHYHYGITSIVMNTNLVPTNCYNIEKQYEIIVNVCDTISNSSHLILLMHHGLWADVPGLPSNPGNYCHSNLKYWNATCSDVNSNFVNAIYPLLVEVKQKGIDVICIMGDVGAQKKKLNYISDDGINFLGCGLYHGSPEDLVLVFTHTPKENKLTWQYQNLDSLLNIQ